MTQEMTHKCVKGASGMDCFELETLSLEEPILKGEIPLKPIQARRKKVLLRQLGRISRVLKKRSKAARLAKKSKFNVRYHQERIPIESVKRRVYDNGPCVY